MGYCGKQVIHPNQLPVVKASFSPKPEQVEWASGLIEAFHDHQKSGKVCCACVCVYMCICISCVCFRGGGSVTYIHFTHVYTVWSRGTVITSYTV